MRRRKLNLEEKGTLSLTTGRREKFGNNRKNYKTIIFVNIEDMTQLLLLGKFEYTGGPIFKVVLEC